MKEQNYLQIMSIVQSVIVLSLLWLAPSIKIVLAIIVATILLPINVFFYLKEVNKFPDKYSKLIRTQYISIIGVVVIAVLASAYFST